MLLSHRAAGLTDALPVAGSSAFHLAIEGLPQAPAPGGSMTMRLVSGGYFQAMGIAIVRGLRSPTKSPRRQRNPRQSRVRATLSWHRRSDRKGCRPFAPQRRGVASGSHREIGLRRGRASRVRRLQRVRLGGRRGAARRNRHLRGRRADGRQADTRDRYADGAGSVPARRDRDDPAAERHNNCRRHHRRPGRRGGARPFARRHAVRRDAGRPVDVRRRPAIVYAACLRRAAQYFFIRRLTARRLAADIFRRRRRPPAAALRAPPFRRRGPPLLPSSALIAWVSLSISRSSAERSDRSCCTSLP